MPIRLTGLASGLDTEAMISALVSSYNFKTDKYKKAQTKLSWKQDAWKTLNAKIYSMYTGLDSLRLSKGYNLKSTSCSDTTKATVTATSNAVNGTQKLNVIQVAQAGYLTGGKLADTTKKGTTLAELGYTGGDGKLNLTMGDGTTKEIAVNQGTTVSQFLDSLSTAGVTASYDEINKRIYVSSKESGTDNDFTLTGANVDGASALSKLGLNVDSDATTATYESYAKYYYDGYDITSGVASGNISQNVKDALAAYSQALKDYNTSSAQNGNLSAAYGYASAYSAMQDALKNSGLTADEQKRMQTLLGMSAVERGNSVMDANGDVYTKKTLDKNGNIVYAHKDDLGNEKFVKQIDTYTGSDNEIYKRKGNGEYENAAGESYKASGRKDAAGNAIYEHTAGDGTKKEITISKSTAYYEANQNKVGTGRYECTDASDAKYTQNAVDGSYKGSDKKLYRLSADETTLIEVDKNGNDISGGKTVSVADKKEIEETVYDTGSELTGVERATDELTSLQGKLGMNKEELGKFISNLTTNINAVNTYEKGVDSVLDPADPYSRKNIIDAIANAYNGGGASGVTSLVNTYASIISNNNTSIEANKAVMEQHSSLADIAKMEDGSEKDAAIASFIDQVISSKNILDNMSSSTNSDAKKIDGQDAIIKLNGIEYKGSSNAFSINGLTITAQAVTGEAEKDAVTIVTQTDTQGIYDKIKGFLTQYNSLINEITALYNAPTAKGFEPLTNDEKDAMSDTDIEQWEEKIKDSIMRRDDSLEGIMNTMTAVMSKGIEVNGKKMYLSDFGIKTLGFLKAPKNEHNAYHIDGDEDNTLTSGKTDLLMDAIVTDPDTLITFMQGLTSNLYNAVGDRMKSSSLSSSYTLYNDKEMASEYSDYTSTIKKWEEKLKNQEDYYYKKFGAMETALSKLQSQTSSLTSLFGG